MSEQRAAIRSALNRHDIRDVRRACSMTVLSPAGRREGPGSGFRGFRLRGARMWSVAPRLSRALLVTTVHRGTGEYTPGTKVPGTRTCGRAALRPAAGRFGQAQAQARWRAALANVAPVWRRSFSRGRRPERVLDLLAAVAAHRVKPVIRCGLGR